MGLTRFVGPVSLLGKSSSGYCDSSKRHGWLDIHVPTVAHVDDIEGGVHPSYLHKACKGTGAWHESLSQPQFRGREMNQHDDGSNDISIHISMAMGNCVLNDRQESDTSSIRRAMACNMPLRPPPQTRS